MTAAQAILDRITPLTTAMIEEMIEQLDARAADEDVTLVRLMCVEALEIRDPQHPIVRASIAAYEAEWEAMK